MDPTRLLCMVLYFWSFILCVLHVMFFASNSVLLLLFIWCPVVGPLYLVVIPNLILAVILYYGSELNYIFADGCPVVGPFLIYTSTVWCILVCGTMDPSVSVAKLQETYELLKLNGITTTG